MMRDVVTKGEKTCGESSATHPRAVDEEYFGLPLPATLLLALTFALTVLAQIGGGVITAAYYLCWFASLVCLLVRVDGSANIEGYPSFLLNVLLLEVVVCGVCYFLTGELAYLNGFLLIFAKTVMVYVVGWALAWAVPSFPGLRSLLLVYVAAALLYGIWVQMSYLPSLSSWLSSEEYLFSQKNSFGQIAGAAVIVLISLPASGKQVGRVLRVVAAAYLTVILVAVQCRTSFAGIVLAALLCVLARRRYGVLIVVVIAALLVLLLIPDAVDYVRHAFLLDKYEGASLDAMSSGRLTLWAQAADAFAENSLAGVGDYYVDDFYLCALASLGVLGGGILIVVWIARFAANIRGWVVSQGGASSGVGVSSGVEMPFLLLLLSAFYFVESLLEGYPPFGPGTCSFLFWILCGYWDGAKGHRGIRMKTGDLRLMGGRDARRD